MILAPGMRPVLDVLPVSSHEMSDSVIALRLQGSIKSSVSDTLSSDALRLSFYRLCIPRLLYNEESLFKSLSGVAYFERPDFCGDGFSSMF